MCRDTAVERFAGHFQLGAFLQQQRSVRFITLPRETQAWQPDGIRKAHDVQSFAHFSAFIVRFRV